MTQMTGLSAPFCRFVDDVELRGEADALKGKDVGQGDFDRCGKCELCEAKQGQEQGPAPHQVTALSSYCHGRNTRLGDISLICYQ